jgi:hypothetical protein
MIDATQIRLRPALSEHEGQVDVAHDHEFVGRQLGREHLAGGKRRPVGQDGTKGNTAG